MIKAILTIIVIAVLICGVYYFVTNTSFGKDMLGQAQVTPTPQQTATANPGGTMHQYSHNHGQGGFGGGQFGNMPSGSTPIFGQVTAISGNTVTVQRMSRNGNGTTITVDLTSSTQYTGGSQSTIQNGTRIAGYGTKNSDGSINAEKITINPSFPTRSSNQ